jgi:hypothetical protein
MTSGYGTLRTCRDSLTMSASDWLGDPFPGMRTVTLSDELRNQFRHNSPVYGTRIAT